jgi:hypothetical protein
MWTTTWWQVLLLGLGWIWVGQKVSTGVFRSAPGVKELILNMHTYIYTDTLSLLFIRLLKIVKFQILAVVSMKMRAIWDIVPEPCRLNCFCTGLSCSVFGGKDCLVNWSTGLDLILYPAARCLSLADWEMIYFLLAHSLSFSLSPSFSPC